MNHQHDDLVLDGTQISVQLQLRPVWFSSAHFANTVRSGRQNTSKFLQLTHRTLTLLHLRTRTSPRLALLKPSPSDRAQFDGRALLPTLVLYCACEYQHWYQRWYFELVLSTDLSPTKVPTLVLPQGTRLAYQMDIKGPRMACSCPRAPLRVVTALAAKRKSAPKSGAP